MHTTSNEQKPTNWQISHMVSFAISAVFSAGSFSPDLVVPVSCAHQTTGVPCLIRVYLCLTEWHAFLCSYI